MEDRDLIVKRIRSRQRRLEAVGKELKEHFVGLDDIIDKILKNIEAWYVIPELLSRPMIICLWGPTGIGKTDLVRRLVKLLSFSDRYCEIELSNKGSSGCWQSSISSILTQNPQIQSDQPSVILLDEIQRFRTVNEDGREIHDYKFKDIWTLLSDGKLPFSVDVDYILQLLYEYNKPSEPKPKDEDEEKDCVADEKTVKNYYSLKQFKNMLRLEESVEEIDKWSDSKKKAVLISKWNDPALFEEEDYSKSLIFISGNLDEAYKTIASKVDEADLDADIFHEMSLKLTMLDIKKALLKRFRPEQIARFGNIHVIYPSLNKEFYRTIIRRKIKSISNSIHDKFGIRMNFADSIYKMIYDNSVFPTQGTRPVFSTISEAIESPTPVFLLKAFLEKKDKIDLYFDKDNICSKIGKEVVKYHYVGALDDIKRRKGLNEDRKIRTAVHEAGHAITYALLTKLAPPQIVATQTSSDRHGFVYCHQNCNSRRLIEGSIKTMLAGVEAERLVFGDEVVSAGCSEDVRHATELAGQMVRSYAMGSYYSHITTESINYLLNTDMGGSNPEIDKIMGRMFKESSALLKDNINLLIGVVDILVEKEKLTAKDFQEICKDFGLEIKIMETEDIVFEDYSKRYSNFKERFSK